MPFPTTPVLDNFNRANGGVGSAWTGPAWQASAYPLIASNRIVRTGAGYGGISWNAGTFGPDTEVYITCGVKPTADVGCFLIIKSPVLTGQYSGYRLDCYPNHSSGQFILYRVDNNTLTQLGTVTQAITAGDSWGLETIGTSFRVCYKAAAGAWTYIGSTFTDTTYNNAGYIGVMLASDSTAAYDDFGGGTAVVNQTKTGTDSGTGTETGSKFATGAPFVAEAGSFTEAATLKSTYVDTELFDSDDLATAVKTLNWPSIGVELSTSNPTAVPTWNNITADVISLSIRRGRQRELDRIEAGTLEVVLRGDDREYDPLNTASPYYPNLYPMRRIRVWATWQSTTYYLFDGYIQSFDQEVTGFSEAKTTISATDGFEVLIRRYLKPGPPFVQTILNISNANILFTGKGGGSGIARPNPFHPHYVPPNQSYGSDLSIVMHARQGL
ncbi:MAG TPA: hypothetical protein VH593_25685, partial [Ktedonobacteraceae bacterium]